MRHSSMSNKGDLNIIQCIYFDKILDKVNLYVVFYSMNVHVCVFEVTKNIVIGFWTLVLGSTEIMSAAELMNMEKSI